MNEQLELGKALKEEGMNKVLVNTPEEWKAFFLDCGRQLAWSGKEFTSEDVLKLCGMPPGSPNAVGATMNALAREQKLTRLRYVQSNRPSRHAAVVAVWKKPPTV